MNIDRDISRDIAVTRASNFVTFRRLATRSSYIADFLFPRRNVYRKLVHWKERSKVKVILCPSICDIWHCNSRTDDTHDKRILCNLRRDILWSPLYPVTFANELCFCLSVSRHNSKSWRILMKFVGGVECVTKQQLVIRIKMRITTQIHEF